MEITGEIVTAYNASRRNPDKFFFVVRDKDGKETKGMAPVRLMSEITRGNVVELKGRFFRGWAYPKEARVIRAAEVEAVVEEFEVGHVGRMRGTRHGSGAAMRVGDGWVTVLAKAMRAEFDEDEFPRRGRGTMRAKVKRNGDAVVVEILNWQPQTRTVLLTIPFSSIYWTPGRIGFKIEGEWYNAPNPVDVAAADLPALKKSGKNLIVRGVAYAHSRGLDEVSWEFETGLDVEVAGGLADVELALSTAATERALTRVRAELRKLVSEGTVVDLTMVHELFLKEGLEATDEDARGVWIRDYDARFLAALQEMGGGRAWAVTDGFLVEVGSWLVWERCRSGAATYVLPLCAPEALTGEPLAAGEWAAVLGRVLPEVNKMDLRYGEVGQALSGSAGGVAFAIHAKAQNGDVDGWLTTVKAATERAPADDAADGLPGLDEILALTEGDK